LSREGPLAPPEPEPEPEAEPGPEPAEAPEAGSPDADEPLAEGEENPT
jgi:hypothetical protein